MSLVLGTGTGSGSLASAQYVVMAATTALPNERVLTGTANRITVTDGGAGLPVTLNTGTLVPLTNVANTFTVGPQTIQTGAIGNIGLILKAAAGQTANGFEYRTSADVVMASIGATGAALFQNSADSLTALQVKNAAGTIIALCVDTTNGRIGVNTATPGYRIHVVAGDFAVTGAGERECIILSTDDNAQLRIDRIAGQSGLLVFSSASVQRWRVGVSNNAETGANAGSDFRFVNYTDAGAYIGIALTIKRSNGFVGINDSTPDAQLDVQIGAAASIGLIVQGAAAQTGDAIRVLTSAGGVLLSVVAAGHLTFAEAVNIVVGTTTGTMIGTAAAQKLGFYGHAPVVQRAKADYNNWAAFTDVVDALVDLGLFDAA